MDNVISSSEDTTERLHYDEMDDKIVLETSYDPSDVIDENARLRAMGGVTFGSKNQRMVLAARVSLGDVARLKNLGYDLLSADPAESHRALLYLKHNEQVFLATDKDVIAEKKVIWR